LKLREISMAGEDRVNLRAVFIRSRRDFATESYPFVRVALGSA
jgi:hypothetical protein